MSLTRFVGYASMIFGIIIWAAGIQALAPLLGHLHEIAFGRFLEDLAVYTSAGFVTLLTGLLLVIAAPEDDAGGHRDFSDWRRSQNRHAGPSIPKHGFD